MRRAEGVAAHRAVGSRIMSRPAKGRHEVFANGSGGTKYREAVGMRNDPVALTPAFGKQDSSEAARAHFTNGQVVFRRRRTSARRS